MRLVRAALSRDPRHGEHGESGETLLLLLLLILLFHLPEPKSNGYCDGYLLENSMASKTPPVNVRLPGDLGERFHALRREFPGLPSSTIMRTLLAPQLSRPLPEQVEIVISGLRKVKSVKQSTNRLGHGAERNQSTV